MPISKDIIGAIIKEDKSNKIEIILEGGIKLVNLYWIFRSWLKSGLS